MKLYSWNVNGIRAVDKKGALAEFINKENPDIVCFQETKAHEDQLDLEFPEYEKFWNSATKKGYSGTAIWSKVPPLTALYGLPDELVTKYKLDSDKYGDPSNEGRVLALEFEKFYLITVYTPNSKGDLTRLELRHKQWDPAFLEYARSYAEKKPVFFCGDLNVAHAEIDLANPKPNVGKHGFTFEEREGFDAMLKNGFYDTFRLFNTEGGNYTWWTHWANARERNIGWRIDYFLASEKAKPMVKAAEIHAKVMGSDHCPISITIDAKA
ncbi:MAG: exoA [Candidatus Saccharibacteria bacterium]|nr:exoA [Candidatus Saccharibacteria bacterium]